jgi:hypothetical protein
MLHLGISKGMYFQRNWQPFPSSYSHKCFRHHPLKWIYSAQVSKVQNRSKIYKNCSRKHFRLPPFLPKKPFPRFPFSSTVPKKWSREPRCKIHWILLRRIKDANNKWIYNLHKKVTFNIHKSLENTPRFPQPISLSLYKYKIPSQNEYIIPISNSYDFYQSWNFFPSANKGTKNHIEWEY